VEFTRYATRTGRAAEALAAVQPLTQLDPYREDGHALLIEASEWSGDQARVRSAYDRFQRIVGTELHAEPRREIARRYEAGPPTGRVLPTDALVPLQNITMHIVDWPGNEPPIIAVPGSA
jgi:DNA-binding SARP family transcriptional activator